MLSTEQMSNALNGMYWDTCNQDFQIPYIGDTKKASFIFRKNLASITWNCMASLERNPTTLPQTQTILKGQSVGGVSIFDLMQVKNYGDGAKELLRLLENNQFRLDLKTACAIHQFVGKEDALEWGVVRNMSVGIGGVEYCPPPAHQLDEIATTGFSYLENEIKDPRERAVATFLFMSRNQFFFDANKRTASLMMNGVLMKNGYWPIMILNKDSEKFHKLLGQFYESGNANNMMKFFSHSVEKMYEQHHQIDENKELTR